MLRLVLAALVLATIVATAFYVIATGEPARGTNATHDVSNDLLAQLEAAVAEDERSVEAWLALGKHHASRNDTANARKALVRAAELAPSDADILVEAARAIAMDHPRKVFGDEAIALLESALRIEPGHERARWFLGVAHRQAGDGNKAALVWESLLGHVDAATERRLRGEIAAARSEAARGATTGGAAASRATARADAGSHALRVHVDIDRAAAARFAGSTEAAVYVMARKHDGTGVPIAVERHALSELPFDTTLDDSDSPMPTQTLSAIDDIDVVAKLSPTGDPYAAPGTPQSQLLRVHLPESQGVSLTIESTQVTRAR
jgi:cytochrome c-type biogenesis protein CcmH